MGKNLPPFILFLLLALAVAPLSAQNEAWRGKVEARLWENVLENGQAEFLVVLRQQADLRPAEDIRDKTAKGRYVYEALLAVAERTQPPLRSLLSSAGAPVNTFWVINAVWSEGDAALIERVAQLPIVARVENNPVWHMEMPQPESTQVAADRTLTPISWGLTKIKADQVWNLGYTGQGVVVGGQDTGYEWNHPAIKNKYRGWDGSIANHNYNGHDAIHSLIGGGSNSCGINLMAPCDDTNHGTHTMGTMTGGVDDDNIIGVAPGATWMGCRNMEENDGTPATYIECFQWFIAPTNLSNGAADPSMAPDVINNSWGCPPSEGCNATNFATMDAVINNVRTAGIFVAVSAGNSGPGCSSIDSPAAIFSGSFTVGATQNTTLDQIATFSSRGPVTVYGSAMKPNISAPGVGITSCVGNDNNSGSYNYSSFSGTSMAGPHIAGVVALIISARPDLKGQVSTIENIIKNTAMARFATAPFCGTDNGTSHPNNVYGWGRVDALAAVNAAVALPVELVDFRATKRGAAAWLQWTTATETDCDRFVVQHSLDAVDWQSLGEKVCTNQGNGLQRYEFTDPAPHKGLHYYRLHQLDYSGKSAYSTIASLVFGPCLGLRIVPQTAEQSAYVEVLGGEEESSWQLDLYAADGRIVAQYTIDQQGTLHWPNVPSGVYAAVVRSPAGGVLAVEKVR
ncbi:MAG: S8 family serine peptidase, partial [Saprospiraceae bacterium]